jgi:7,8-didemethyl-8-hydroxy-5-deazariboflavin synthase CofH subunit
MPIDSLSSLFDGVTPEIRSILNRALEDREISWQEGLRLLQAENADLHATIIAADELRRRQTGSIGTFIVNRNINFTNICLKRCRFCAFSRSYADGDAFTLSIEDLVRLAKEADELGATEICIQAALHPEMDGELYVDITRAIKAALPEIQLHAFSPQEIVYGAARSGASVREYLTALKDAGLDTVPGTSAEILDQEIRDLISPGRITVQEWVEVITTAHAVGIPTTATIMYGHIETPEHWVKHMNLLRDIQHETHGFTEFVPLSLIYQESPMYRKKLFPEMRQGASGLEVVRMHAVARVFLGACFRNIQCSWVKEGPKFAQYLLAAGANDIGGTLMNESISSSAGSQNGQFLRPGELRSIIRQAGRIPAQRDTRYRLLKVFREDDGEVSPLDLVEDAGQRFGSYPHPVTG